MKYYKLALLKAYFEKGYSFLSYPKYVLFLMGLGDVISSGGDYKNVVILGFLIAVGCFFVGWLFFKTRFVDAELEVANQYNPFMREMREWKDSSSAIHQPKYLNSNSP